MILDTATCQILERKLATDGTIEGKYRNRSTINDSFKRMCETGDLYYLAR